MVCRLILAAALLAATAARAHAPDAAYLDAEVVGARVKASLDLGAEVAEQMTKAGPLRSPQAVEAAAGALLRATLGSGTLDSSGQPCALGLPRATYEPLERRVRVQVEAACPAEVEDLRWTFPFVDAGSLDYRVLVKAVLFGEERNFILEPGASTLRVRGERDRSFSAFVSMGIRHIGAHPDEWRGASGWHLPAGIDHILFLLALILAGGGLWRTLATVTGFTVGHSVTLAIATLWPQLAPPSRPIEAAIAASIIYVALRDLFAKEPSKHGFAIACAFGLVHGFGFATALSELHLSRSGLASALFGFNLGVEIGQAVIVALLAPLIVLLRKRRWFDRIGSKACAASIAAAGCFWLVQRTLL
jgi:hypothetical protein